MKIRIVPLLLLLLAPALVGCQPEPEPEPPPTPPPAPEPPSQAQAVPLLCYEADQAEEIEAGVDLRTRYGVEEGVRLGRLLWLCEPVHKAHDPADLPDEPPPFLPLSCYEIGGDPVGATVQLSNRNEFYDGPAVVQQPVMLCDPVERKEREGLPPDEGQKFPAHLKGYELDPIQLQQQQSILVRDQFGLREITFQDSSHLLEPATKNDPDLELPDELPLHCYDVVSGPPADAVVTIKDQFSDYRLEIIVPLYFCDPTERS